MTPLYRSTFLRILLSTRWRKEPERVFGPFPPTMRLELFPKIIPSIRARTRFWRIYSAYGSNLHLKWKTLTTCCWMCPMKRTTSGLFKVCFSNKIDKCDVHRKRIVPSQMWLNPANLLKNSITTAGTSGSKRSICAEIRTACY